MIKSDVVTMTCGEQNMIRNVAAELETCVLVTISKKFVDALVGGRTLPRPQTVSLTTVTKQKPGITRAMRFVSTH